MSTSRLGHRVGTTPAPLPPKDIERQVRANVQKKYGNDPDMQTVARSLDPKTGAADLQSLLQVPISSLYDGAALVARSMRWDPAAFQDAIDTSAGKQRASAMQRLTVPVNNVMFLGDE